MRFAIVDYQRAEEIFDRLAGHFFLMVKFKKKEPLGMRGMIDHIVQ